MTSKITDETIQTWLHHVTNTDVKIWVENPETVKDSGFMAKSYTTFRVLLKSSDSELIGVRHRFSEFCALRDVLKAKYTPFGICVPSLPNKKVIGKLGKDFITERMQGLTLFCESVVSNPWLRKDPAWIDFMSTNASKGDDKKDIEEDMLQAILDRLNMPSMPLERTYELKDELNVVDKQLQSVLDASRAVQKSQAALHQANDAFHHAVDSWANSEKQDVIYLAGRSLETISCDTKIQETEKVQTMVSRLDALCAERHVATQDVAEYSNILFSTYLDHELLRNASMRELLKYHDDIVSSIDSLRVKVEKLESQQSTKWEQLQESKRNLEMKSSMLNTFYKGFYFFTVPLQAKCRSNSLRRAMSSYGATTMVTAHTISCSAGLFLKDLSLSATTAISETSQLLDQLSLKPLDQPPEGLPPPAEGISSSGPWVEALYKSATSNSSLLFPTSTSSPSKPVSTEEDTAPQTQNTKASSEAENSAQPVERVSTNPFDEPAGASEEAPPEVQEPETPPAPPPVNAAILGDLVGGVEDEKATKNADLWG
mmetsp:Transcript_602/g.1010  ORF Transcript_602/g.1010 Transcript_602/m.1010 type:complete len:542 (+) Transcript_602:52-1677(+)